MENLLEKYTKRISVAESYYAKNHTDAMSNSKKLVLARCLENVSTYLNESFSNSIGTQRADMGAYKQFCMTVTNIALPNLIAYDIALTQPLSSFSGNIAYLEFIAGSNKGAVSQGDLFNNPFQLGDAHLDYTSDRVVEQFTAIADQTEFTVAWTPVSDRKDDAGKYADVKVLVNGAAVEVKGVDSKTGKITVDKVTASDEVRIAYV